jgi:hypothetical protein
VLLYKAIGQGRAKGARYGIVPEFKAAVIVRPETKTAGIADLM